MKKIFTYLLPVFFGLLFTSCFDIIEDIQLNKNGSGKYSMTYDLSGLFTDPMMKGIMMEALKEQKEFNLGNGGALEMDSVMYIKNAPEFEKIKGSDKLKETAKIHTVISEKKGEMLINFEFEFEKADEISAFFQSMADGSGQSNFGGFEMFLNGNNFTFKKKCLTRETFENKTDPAMNEDDMAMMKMFLAGANFKTNYHLPGKVKKSSIQNSEMDGKTVTVTTSILDLMDKKVSMDGEIRFKN